MNARCKPGDLAVFVPPAERHLIGRFLTVVRYEPVLSVLLHAHAWHVRLKGDPVPCAITGLPIVEGVACDDCLQPIRPPNLPAFDKFVMPRDVEKFTA